jgi:hypothetical protein
VNVSIGDLLDRLSIVLLKIEHYPTNVFGKAEHKVLEKEYFDLKELYIDYNLDRWLNFLKKINGNIWDLESDVRKGALDNDLPEVGKRAIAIRKFNGLRVEFKNIINELLKDGCVEQKLDHISQI